MIYIYPILRLHNFKMFSDKFYETSLSFCGHSSNDFEVIQLLARGGLGPLNSVSEHLENIR